MLAVVSPALSMRASPSLQTQLIELRTSNYQLKEQQAKLTTGVCAYVHVGLWQCVCRSQVEMIYYVAVQRFQESDTWCVGLALYPGPRPSFRLLILKAIAHGVERAGYETSVD